MTITRHRIRNLESKAIQGYSWYIRCTLKQEVALYERIARDLIKNIHSILNKNNGRVKPPLKTEQMKKLQTLVLIIAPSYFIGRLLIGLIFNI